MEHWYRQLQTAARVIDRAIEEDMGDAVTLKSLGDALGYSPWHMTRMFHRLTGMRLRDYLRRRKLAFALVEVRDSGDPLLHIAMRYGFSSHEAFTRAFKQAYGVTPAAYRKNPVPVVLRTRINPLDCYLLGRGEIGMANTKDQIKIYRARVPAHRFLHIKNYDSNGCFDFWEKQDAIPGQDCDTVCGLLDSITGKLDGDDSITGAYSGQIMAYPREADGRRPEAYGVRLPAGWAGSIPDGMLLLDIPEAEYMVFEHGAFDFGTQGGGVFRQIEEAIASFDWSGAGCTPDDSAGRIAYYYHDPSRYLKRVLPVK